MMMSDPENGCTHGKLNNAHFLPLHTNSFGPLRVGDKKSSIKSLSLKSHAHFLFLDAAAPCEFIKCATATEWYVFLGR
jgi:hypothetical protein